MIEYAFTLLAIPIGILLATLTKDEKEIYTKKPYFPIIIPGILLITITTYFTRKELFLTMTFILIMILTWKKTSNKKINDKDSLIDKLKTTTFSLLI